MLRGQPTVFLSCSERFKSDVAIPIRDELVKLGLNVIIVSDEPLPMSAAWDPDSKVEYYLNGSDAVIALCTPDDRLADGATQPRQNIVDEIQRARHKPHIRDKIQVLKTKDVRLPSNINPTYDRLDIQNPKDAVPIIHRQLLEWGVVGQQPATPPSLTNADQDPLVDVEEVTRGLTLVDYDNTGHRAYQLLLNHSRANQRRIVSMLIEFILDAGKRIDFKRQHDERDYERLVVCTNVLEALNRLAPGVVTYDQIENMALSNDLVVRSSASSMLLDRSISDPGSVPIDLVGKLNRPASEDWYVAAPAMAAAKTLALTREDAREIFAALAQSGNPEDRVAAAEAFLDIANVDPAAVDRDIVLRLSQDEDASVAEKASAVLKVANVDRQAGDLRKRRPFGI